MLRKKRGEGVGINAFTEHALAHLRPRLHMVDLLARRPVLEPQAPTSHKVGDTEGEEPHEYGDVDEARVDAVLHHLDEAGDLEDAVQTLSVTSQTTLHK